MGHDLGLDVVVAAELVVEFVVQLCGANLEWEHRPKATLAPP